MVATLDKMLSMGANVNMYPIAGGTSFGFKAGANFPPFQPVETSYDFDAPISESGELREKYFAIKKTIEKHTSPSNEIIDTTHEIRGGAF